MNKWFRAKPLDCQIPSNDDQARLMGHLAVRKFIEEFGPGKKGEGCKRLRLFFRNNPGVIITSTQLHLIGIGTESDRRRRDLHHQGFITETLSKGREYRIICFDKQKAANPTLNRCSADIRAQVWERDGGVCQKCTYRTGTIHPWSNRKENHDIHRTDPGSVYTLEGCLLYCVPCNNGISNTVIPKPEKIQVKTLFYRLPKEKRYELLDELSKELV
jgi:hypothetical protein